MAPKRNLISFQATIHCFVSPNHPLITQNVDTWCGVLNKVSSLRRSENHVQRVCRLWFFQQIVKSCPGATVWQLFDNVAIRDCAFDNCPRALRNDGRFLMPWNCIVTCFDIFDEFCGISSSTPNILFYSLSTF